MASAGGPPDPQECLLRSGVRSGLKREFAFALRSQAQLSASLGRTRSAKSSVASAAPVRRDIKKTKKSSLPPKDVVVVVDCDEKPVVDIVPSANEVTRETLSVVESRGDSVESMKTSITVELGDEVMVDFVPSINTAAGETLASFDVCGESALVTALPPEEPSKASAIVDCHDEPKMHAVTLKSGDVLKTHASVDCHGEFAVEVAPRVSKPIKVFVRSRLRGKVGGLMKCPNRWVDTLGATIDTAIVLDDDSSCKSNGSFLDDRNAMENFVTIDCDDELNVDDSPSKNPSKSSATFQVDDTVQGFLHECAPPTLIIEGIRPLQGVSTIVDYQDGILVEGNQPEMTIMENVQGICKSDSKFSGQASRRLTRSSIKAKEENSGPEVGADISCEPIASEGTIDRAKSLKGSSGPDIGVGISSKSIGSEGAIGLANSIKGSLGSTPKNNMELKMSKKISLKKVPNNVRELLSTGLLEGFPVKYYAPTRKQCELQGFIKGNGILCSCATCDCSTVVSAYIFELHAGSTKKHPADFILLQNGNSLHDVVKACRVAPLDTLEAVIQGAIGPVPPKKCFACHKCNVFFSTSRTGKFALLCDSCLESKQVQTPNSLIRNANSARLARTSSTLEPSARTISVIEPSTNTSSILESLTRTSSVLEPSTKASSMLEPLTRTSSTLEPSTRTSSELEPSNGSLKSFSLNNSNKKSSQGRLTRKDLGLHKLVFMNGILPEGTEVGYYVRGKRLLEGYIKDSGIYCQCCNTVVSPSQFEAHAGRAARRKPYNNIYTSNGVSLHELSVSLSKDRKLSATENDDLCSICADGGNLLLCDLCPRAFHPECVGLRIPPEGDWYCQYCHNLHQRERSVACNDNAIAAGRVAGVDPIEQIFQKSIRTVTTSLCDVGGCAVCRSHDFSKSKFDDRTVMICDQCEKEYHVGCLREEKMADLKELPEGEWFCCTDCSRIWITLQELILRGAQLLPAVNTDVIRTKMKNKGVNRDSDVDVRWRLLSGKTSAADSKLLLSRAVSIFHESFDPIIDATTGRDLIPSMVYGRTVRDQDFGGMICAVLVVGSSVVSAGILRVMGTEVAELPLVATSRENQGLGYFQSLYSCIETLLGSLNVKNFLLPAAEEAESIWTTKFGFTKINSDQLQKILKGARTTVFQGTSMLHKPVPLQVSSQECEQLREGNDETYRRFV